jgi:hypothetical protein
MIWRYQFVHCVLVRISTVAEHSWPAIRGRDEVCGVGQGTTEVDVEVGRVCLDLKDLIVGRLTVVVVRVSCYSHY